MIRVNKENFEEEVSSDEFFKIKKQKKWRM